MREIKWRYRFKNYNTDEIKSLILKQEWIENQSPILAGLFDFLEWEILSRDLFIGLLDKNGKEIYESDLLKTFDGEIGEVSFELPFCVWGIQNKRHFRSFENIFNTWSKDKLMGNLQPLIEVIGNIYEGETK